MSKPGAIPSSFALVAVTATGFTSNVEVAVRVGETLADASVGRETDWVVAVRCDGETVLGPDPESFRFESADEAVIAGTWTCLD